MSAYADNRELLTGENAEQSMAQPDESYRPRSLLRLSLPAVALPNELRPHWPSAYSNPFR